MTYRDKEKYNEYARKWYHSHKKPKTDARKEYEKKWRDANRDYIRAYCRAYQKEHRLELYERLKIRRREDPATHRHRALIQQRRARKILTDSYVRLTLKMDKKTAPKVLVEAKRELIKIRRLLRNEQAKH
jgi:hypothetical protein